MRYRQVSEISHFLFFFSSRRRHTRSVSAFLLNRSSDLFVSSHLSEVIYVWCYCWRYCFCSCWWRMSKLFGGGQKAASGGIQRSEERRVGEECRSRWSAYH